MNYENLCKEAQKLIKTVGKYVLDASRNPLLIEEKGAQNYVTNIDKEAEKKLVQGLSKLLPHSTFLTEEETVQNQNSELLWIIDPIDGTTNFIHHIPCFAISVALYEKNNPVIGIIYEINADEMFHTYKGGKCYLNKKEISVSKTSSISNSLFATGFPYDNEITKKSHFELLHYLTMNTRGVRRLGAAAVDLAYVAAGRLEVFYEFGLSPWDVAAGAFLVEQAGGKVCDLNNTGNFLTDKSILAGNSKIFTDFYETIIKYN